MSVGSSNLGSIVGGGATGSVSQVLVVGGIVAGTLWFLDMLPGVPGPTHLS